MDDMVFLEQLYDKIQGNILGHDHFFSFQKIKIILILNLITNIMIYRRNI